MVSFDILSIKNEILNLCKKFRDSGQSGGSAPYTAGSIIHEIKNKISSNIVLEIAKDPDSLTYEFSKLSQIWGYVCGGNCMNVLPYSIHNCVRCSNTLYMYDMDVGCSLKGSTASTIA